MTVPRGRPGLWCEGGWASFGRLMNRGPLNHQASKKRAPMTARTINQNTMRISSPAEVSSVRDSPLRGNSPHGPDVIRAAPKRLAVTTRGPHARGRRSHTGHAIAWPGRRVWVALATSSSGDTPWRPAHLAKLWGTWLRLHRQTQDVRAHLRDERPSPDGERAYSACRCARPRLRGPRQDPSHVARSRRRALSPYSQLKPQPAVSTTQ